ncbi:SDR family NAD(P)-dependent oxidoreductase [Occallatibacter savannae]|uniref:SDR family NAD(P)-dependent oxidoreductase n=1 Tax=Occallatibacter savannae TaxID=1002691 RepID=UPI000D69F6E6|nr:SDR family NAD(P)-dependent oxidoreductase [Occallatibacter savannae]
MNELFIGIGAGPGMGFSTAARFAKEGFDLVLTSRNIAKIQPLVAELKAATGRNVEMFALDSTDAASVQNLADRFGDRVRVLHYNAAVMQKSDPLATSVAAFIHNLQVDVVGAYSAIQSFVPKMQSRGKGTILLTGGGLALAPHPNYLSLSIGKAGIRSMAKALFRPLGAKGIHLATLTVAKIVAAGSADADAAAEAFWSLHSEQEGKWTWEATLS